jgi:hypothetical protein
MSIETISGGTLPSSPPALSEVALSPCLRHGSTQVSRGRGENPLKQRRFSSSFAHSIGFSGKPMECAKFNMPSSLTSRS